MLCAASRMALSSMAGMAARKGPQRVHPSTAGTSPPLQGTAMTLSLSQVHPIIPWHGRVTVGQKM